MEFDAPIRLAYFVKAQSKSKMNDEFRPHQFIFM